MKKFILSISLLLLGSSHVFSQISEMPDFKSIFEETPMPSPEMASMVRNIVYPVNYSTGLVNISIPLFEIKCADIKLPLTLSYHASGVKLSAASGWVGQNWTLSCEPMISRTIRGRDDFWQSFKCDIDLSDRSQSYLYAIAKGEKDGVPDDYYFTLPECQGEFVYVQDAKSQDKQFVPLPYQNLRVTTPRGQFKIEDDKGRAYNFRGVCETIGSSSPIGWKATSIVSANRTDSIVFTYFQNSEYSKSNNDYIVVIDDFSYRMGTYTDREYFRGSFQSNANQGKEELMCPLRDYWMQDPVVYSSVYNGNDNFCNIYTYQSNNSGQLFREGKYQNFLQAEHPKTLTNKLSGISFPEGKVAFLHSYKKDIKGDVLEEIDVYNCSNELVRRIKFGYELRVAQQRCYLTSLTITGSQGQKAESYKFDYYDMNDLPAVGNKSIDYWGYYNGVYRRDSTTLVPYQTIETTRSHRRFDKNGNWLEGYDVDHEFKVHIGSPLSREADESSMRHGTLRSITYPTGSKDVFEYEAHRYHDGSKGKVRIAGGLRIRKISTYAKDVLLSSRSFKYGKEEDGIGYGKMTSNLEHFMLEQTKQYIDPVTVNYPSSSPEGVIGFMQNKVISARHRTYFSNPVQSNTYNGGSSVMYDYVTEYNGAPEKNMGKTIYHYQIDTDSLSAPVMTTPKRDSKNYWRYGQLLDKETYKNVNGRYSLVERLNNQYEEKVGNFGVSKALEVSLSNVIEGDWTSHTDLLYANTANPTQVEIGAKVLNSSECWTYDDKGKFNRTVKTSTYNNTSPLLLKSTSETKGDGEKLTTAYRYPVDFTESIYGNMVRDYQFPVVQTDYTTTNESLSVKTPFTRLTYGGYFPKSTESKYNSMASRERLAYQYNKYGNKVEEVRDGKEHVVFLYGYNHQEIIAVIMNATYAEVSKALGSNVIQSMESSTDMSKWRTTFETLRKSLPLARVFSYEHKPLVGISSVTAPDGQTTYYEYDELGRLSKAYQIRNGKREVLKNYQYQYKTEK